MSFDGVDACRDFADQEEDRLRAALLQKLNCRVPSGGIRDLGQRWREIAACENAEQLLLRMNGGEVVLPIDVDEDVEPVAPVKRSRNRKPTLAGVARQAAKAGVEVAGYEVRPDGTIKVITGKPTTTNPDDDRNEWDTVQ